MIRCLYSLQINGLGEARRRGQRGNKIGHELITVEAG